MTDKPEVIEILQDGLKNYVKPREQANYIRRIIALHLGSCSSDGPAKLPLSLTSTSSLDVKIEHSTKGVYLEYLEALRANIDARHKFEAVLQNNTKDGAHRPTTPEVDKSSLLEDRIALLKLDQKRQKLQATQRCLDEFVDKPAALESFLDPDSIFEDAIPLPGVPNEVVNSLIFGENSSQPDLKARATQLEKIVLRAKFQLRQEEGLLARARVQSRSRPDILSNATKLEALNATRNELIAWIETELGRAGGDDRNEAAGMLADKDSDPVGDQVAIDTHLKEIKIKYDRYLASRKSLLALVSPAPQQSLKPDLGPTPAAPPPETTQEPVDYLLLPQIEQLLSLSRAQKVMIAQKAHISATLSKQTKETAQVLKYLAAESQLLPQYPMKDSLRRRSGLQDDLISKRSEQPDLSKRVQPWVFAADSAKIADLEAIAETIEGGQVALENSVKTVHDMEKLLGLTEREDVQHEDSIEDMWLDTKGLGDVSARKHTKKETGHVKGDPWSTLHGSLGLLGHEE